MSRSIPDAVTRLLERPTNVQGRSAWTVRCPSHEGTYSSLSWRRR
jgi:hypothetical protein